ncbi:hypothetical protein AMECASPLE_028035 [Ameca splendens]|uniref:Ubiquitin-like protease family profile domain-containing protein n=1 Tax=Ameca splendens TaxID=208324 RepID=A0ABV0XIE2_9TELE
MTKHMFYIFHLTALIFSVTHISTILFWVQFTNLVTGYWQHPSERRNVVLDPMGNDSLKIKQCLTSTRAFVRKRGLSVSRWTASTLPHTLQKDSTSCGVFVLKIDVFSVKTTCRGIPAV